MPTENRSSNTEQMVSVPRDEVEHLVKLLRYQTHPGPSPHAEFWQGLLDAPAAQHQGEPVLRLMFWPSASARSKLKAGRMNTMTNMTATRCPTQQPATRSGPAESTPEIGMGSGPGPPSGSSRATRAECW